MTKINANKILNEPGASFWLKDRIREIGRLDIVDHLRDVEILEKLLQQELMKILVRPQRR